MKSLRVTVAIAGILFLLVVGYSVIETFSVWKVPESLTGNWVGKQKVTIRYHNHGKYSFITTPDSVEFILSIKENGNVSGSLGSANFEGCSVFKNRGWVGRKLNIKTDYIITGKLAGVIANVDSLADKKISIPFRLADNTILGSIFHLQQRMDVFPMAHVQLVKQP